MREVSCDRYEIIKLAHPNARVEHRDGSDVVVIPTYDVATDTSGEQVLKLVANRDGTTKFQPGDVLHHTKTGKPFNIVDPLKAFLKLRRGPKSDG